MNLSAEIRLMAEELPRDGSPESERLLRWAARAQLMEGTIRELSLPRPFDATIDGEVLLWNESAGRWFIDDPRAYGDDEDEDEEGHVTHWLPLPARPRI
jgi:hypothetical protein